MDKLIYGIVALLAGAIGLPIGLTIVAEATLEYYEKTPWTDSLMTTFFVLLFVVMVIVALYLGTLSNASSRSGHRR